jgi:hypothetical protein
MNNYTHPFAIAQKAPRAKLLLYPDAGHAFLFQYADDFCAEVLRFTANLGPGAHAPGIRARGDHNDSYPPDRAPTVR